MNNWGNWLRGAAAAAVLAVGGVAAHSAGFLRNSADDVVRLAPRAADDVPLSPPRDPLPSPPTGIEAGVTDDLVREGNEDLIAKDVICFALDNFYDFETGSLVLPSGDEFAISVVEAVAPEGSAISYRIKAASLHATLTDPDLNIATVAEDLAC